MLRTAFAATLTVVLGACAPPPGPPATTGLAAPFSGLDDRDYALEMCRKKIAATKSEAPVAGTPGLDERRRYVLGRGLGEPVVFTAAPGEPATDEPRSHADVIRLLRRPGKTRAERRAEILREGYLYTEDPEEAYALVKELRIDQLFDHDEVWLLRGEAIHRLKKVPERRGHRYEHADGPHQGEPAQVLLFDRLAETRAGVVDGVMHRDVRSLRDREGFDRYRRVHATDGAAVAELRFGGEWVTGLVEAKGAHLELSCLDADGDRRAAIDEHLAASAPRRRALLQLRHTVDRMVAERLPFDRPWDAEDHLSDGQLRPSWEWAYKKGNIGFMHDGNGYAVFDEEGRPHPPQMCVELILDTYERASGTWYASKDQGRERVKGLLDFRDLGIHNRAGVMAFERYAQEHPKLFDASRFEERIEFRERERYFDHLVAQSDRIEPGDVVAIQGPKPDGYIHQHAILVEDVDPITGMAFALVDQMKRPRRRTWEMIMREAPRRALLYHVEPKDEVLLRLDPEKRAVEVAKSD